MALVRTMHRLPYLLAHAAAIAFLVGIIAQVLN